jgi:hypothetical protein
MRVRAIVRAAVTGPPPIDSLLASVEAQRAGLVAGFGPLQPVEIPIARESAGRFHLCSAALAEYDAHELRWVNRKFPLAEAQIMAGPRLKRVNISAGACKSYRLPHEAAWPKDDTITWFAAGDRDRVRELLGYVTHLGRRRAVGRGAVREWIVEPWETWEGFPVVLDGKPLRPLPLDWPGLVEPAEGYGTLTFPYWDHVREDRCAMPDRAAG